MTSQDFSEITTRKPVKSLLTTLNRRAGRNHRGVITSRHRGGGAKRRYRLISWKLPDDFEATVKEIEYDPNRSARLARLETSPGKFYYIIAPKDLKVGQTVRVGDRTPIEAGNRLSLRQIPLGSMVHNLELRPKIGAQIVRSAGTGAQLMAKDEKYARIKLPSGEVRFFHLDSRATLGVVGNEHHKNIKLGKAGRRRHMGRRPRIRGVATNAADHPHGGGVGKSKGYKTPVTPWGQPTLGYKTRPKRKTNRMIATSRHVALQKKRRRK